MKVNHCCQYSHSGCPHSANCIGQKQTKSSFRILVLVPLLLLLGSCTSSIKSEVVTFHEGPLPQGETIRVVAVDTAKKGSLEFEHYAGMVRDNLRTIGYNPVTGDEPAELLAEMDYSVGEGMTNVRSRPDTFNRGFARYHFYYGHFHDPFYFGLYSDWKPDVYSFTVYNRKLEMNIVRNDGNREVLFEGRVQSIGRDQEIARIMPYLITAMFRNFPGESGVTKVVTIGKDS